MDQGRSWSDLPRDILGLIRSHLFEVDFTTFGDVCTSWQSTPAKPPSPFLITMNDRDHTCKFYHPAYTVTSYKSYTSTLHGGTQICSSNFGWLLMSEGELDDSFLFFFNPMTLEKILLPELQESFKIFHFSAPPTSSDCTVIAVQHMCPGGASVGIIKRGQEDWSISYHEYDHRFNTSYCNPVFLDDRYYFMGDDGDFAVYDVKTNNLEFCGEKYVPLKKRFLSHPVAMVEDNGGLLVAFETLEYQEIRVAKFVISENKWEDLESLGDDRMLYVSRGASYLEKAFAKGMGNKIYFPKFRKGKGVFYSLATNMYHSVDGSYCSNGPYKLVQPLFSSWIKPLYSKASVEDLKWCEMDEYSYSASMDNNRD